jgi:hypothetical protein
MDFMKKNIFVTFFTLVILIINSCVSTNSVSSSIDRQNTSTSITNPLIGIWRVKNPSGPITQSMYFGEDFTFLRFFNIREANNPMTVDNRANVPDELVNIMQGVMLADARDNPLIINGTYSYSGNRITITVPKLIEGVWQKNEETGTWLYSLYPNGDLYLQIGDQKILYQKDENELPFIIEKTIDDSKLIGMSIEQVEQTFSKKLESVNNGYYKIPLYFPDYAMQVQLFFENDKVSRIIYFFRGSQNIWDNYTNKLNDVYGPFSIENNEYLFKNNLPENVNVIALAVVDDKRTIGIIYIGVNSSLKI